MADDWTTTDKVRIARKAQSGFECTICWDVTQTVDGQEQPFHSSRMTWSRMPYEEMQALQRELLKLLEELAKRGDEAAQIIHDELRGKG